MEPTKRDLKQAEVVNVYQESTLDRLSLILCTGFGKSKVVIDILKGSRPYKNVYILVNSTDLRDKSWKTEFMKYEAEELWKTVKIFTYQAAYKLDPEEHDLTDCIVIADEVDFAADTTKYGSFFTNFPTVPVIGITGFVTEEKKEWFEENLPPIYTYTMAQAQEDGILNGTHFVFVKYELATHKDLKIQYKKNNRIESFMTSENASYEHAQKSFIKALAEKQNLSKRVFDEELSTEEYDKEFKKLDAKVQYAIKKKKDVLLKLNSSVQVIHRLRNMFKPTDKVVIFSALTSQSAKVTQYTYNGKGTPAQNKEIFEAFDKGSIKELGVCSKINRGVNVDSLNIAIFESYFGSDTQAIQRFGRMARLNPDQTATVYILLPYYRKANAKGGYDMAETQQIIWAKKMLSSTIVKSHETIDLRRI